MNRVDVMRHRELDNGSCVPFYSDVLSALQASHVVFDSILIRVRIKGGRDLEYMQCACCFEDSLC